MVKTPDDLFQFCYWFHRAWENVDTTTMPEEDTGGTIKSAMRAWFLERAAGFCRQTEEMEEQERRAILLRLGQCYVFMDGGASVLDNARELYLRTLLADQWEEIYATAVNYIKTRRIMLSVDELRVLAKYWRVSLRVNGETYGTDEHDILFSVSLTNPSQNHWEVIIPDNTSLEFRRENLRLPSSEPQRSEYPDMSTANLKIPAFQHQNKTSYANTRQAPLPSLAPFDFSEIRDSLTTWEQVTLARLQTPTPDQENIFSIDAITKSLTNKQAELEQITQLVEQEQIKTAPTTRGNNQTCGQYWRVIVMMMTIF